MSLISFPCVNCTISRVSPFPSMLRSSRVRGMSVWAFFCVGMFVLRCGVAAGLLGFPKMDFQRGTLLHSIPRDTLELFSHQQRYKVHEALSHKISTLHRVFGIPHEEVTN